MVWNKPMTTNGNYTNNPDCGVWDNDPKKLCFNCDSCKAGFLEDKKMIMMSDAKVMIIFVTWLIIWYASGVMTFKENCSDSFALPR